MKYVFAYLTHLQVSNFFLLFFVLSNYQTSAENVGKRPNAKKIILMLKILKTFEHILH